MAYTNFISKNVAPLKTRRIGIYNNQGNRVGQIPLGSLTPPNDKKKLYSFGALSDVHIVYTTATSDFQKALTYLNEDIDVAFTCIAGDLTDDGTVEQLAQYKAVVDAYSADTPVYAIAGNHEATNEPNTTERLMPYTEQPLYYSITHGNDLFIMVGEYRWNKDFLFDDGELQWLYETLEANRNKRCFVFFHIFPWGDSGNAKGAYTNDLFSGTQGDVFKSLMAHYKNVTLFHGHSHIKFYLQEVDEKANYSEAFGYRSVHIPSTRMLKHSLPRLKRQASQMPSSQAKGGHHGSCNRYRYSLGLRWDYSDRSADRQQQVSGSHGDQSRSSDQRGQGTQ